MTLTTTTNKASYSGNGNTTTFAYAFKILANSDLKVYIRSANGTETLKTITTHYTVTGVGSASGGNVVFTVGNIPTNTETVVIQRVVPLTQTHDYVENDPFPAESHEQGLDRLTMHVQQLQEEGVEWVLSRECVVAEGTTTECRRRQAQPRPGRDRQLPRAHRRIAADLAACCRGARH